MRYLVEVEREEDGGWLAEVRQMPGAVAFGETREEALRAAEALVLRTLADQLEHKELPAKKLDITFVAA
jgi:predicted RNase H-like HicB family nuclease